MSSLYRTDTIGKFLTECLDELIAEERLPAYYYDRTFLQYDHDASWCLTDKESPHSAAQGKITSLSAREAKGGLAWYRSVDSVYTFMIRNAILAGESFVPRAITKNDPPQQHVSWIKVVAVDGKSVHADIPKAAAKIKECQARGGGLQLLDGSNGHRAPRISNEGSGD